MAADYAQELPTADEAWQRLLDGNARFVRGESRFPSMPQEGFAELAKGQRPFAAILGCADSRVPPELIFGAGFGELFVVRVAGNAISPEVAGSLEYAGLHLHTPLLVVVDGLLPALERVDEQAPPDRQLAQAVEANVRYTMARILESQAGPVEGRMKLVGAIYEISTGRVRFLE